MISWQPRGLLGAAGASWVASVGLLGPEGASWSAGPGWVVSWEPRGPPVASGSFPRGLRERSENPGWPPGGLVSLLGLWEPPGRRALGGSCDVGRSWVAFEPPEPASGKLPRKKLPAQLATMSVPTWLAAMAPTPGMQTCTKLAEPRRNPRANHPNNRRPKHRP